MTYLSHTDDERREMLHKIGVKSSEELFADIPASLRAPELKLPEALSEVEIRRELDRIKKANCDLDCSLFLGAGSYNHFIPAALPTLVMRNEFYTAYTPYQPEISQGMLQAIFEYQTMMCALTGLDVSNASMYDGSTALYEAGLMAMRVTRKRKKIIVDGAISPIYRKVLDAYAGNLELDFVTVPHKDGKTDVDAIEALLDKETAAVMVSNPNFFGTVQDFSELADKVHATKALLIMSVNPVALGVLKTPAEMGADIVTGEAQPFGSPMFFGGPYIGFLCARTKLARQMPGRIISETTDVEGKRGFVMTLQTREQHIRRAKATSNICSNQGLVVVAVAAYLSLIGKKGIQEMAIQNISKAEYAKKALSSIDGVEVKWESPTFNEFVITLPKNASDTLKKLVDENIIGGLALSRFYDGMENDVLVCATEMNTREEIDRYVEELRRCL